MSLLRRMPRQLPPLGVMLHNIGGPSARDIARALDVSERTVWRWLADDHAPRAAALALFWVSEWGYSQVESNALFILANSRGLAEALKRENAALQARIERLVSLADYGSANEPLAVPPGGLAAAGSGSTRPKLIMPN